MDKGLEDLLPLYALGALSEEERARVERYLESDRQAMARAREFQATARALSDVAQPFPASEASKESLMRRLRAGSGVGGLTGKRAAERRMRRVPGLLGRLAPALSLVVAAVSLGAVLATRDELVQVEAQNLELQRQVQDHQQVLRIFSEPNLISIEVLGTDEQPLAHARFFAGLDGRTGVLLAAGLSPLQAGSTYQAWLIRDGTPFPAGIFQASAGGLGTLSVEAEDVLGLYDAVAVSVEPALGSLQPTGPIVLLGSVSG
ncbi:MAG: anti-sigma factor [Anaerolineales bacterium]